MDAPQALQTARRVWKDSILPQLVDYVAIPNESPLFDPDWAANGHMHRAVELAAAWCRERPLEGLRVDVIELEGRTPVLLLELPGAVDDTVLLYGHLDKQPPMTGWEPGLGPWKPVLRDGKLYGRGGADDGYAVFASLTALEILREQGREHARCVVLIECCEESGSGDLPAYMDALSDRIGTPSLVVCLDSGCGNYDQLWATTSLRGMAVGELVVEGLREGVHSGDAGGIVPETFRILRERLSRLEDAQTGELLLPELHVPIPEDRRVQAAGAAEQLGDTLVERFPFADGVNLPEIRGADAVLARTWRPALAITGQDGLPALAKAGNVMRPRTALKLSLRLPPSSDAASALEAVKRVLEEQPLPGARVRFEAGESADGWNSPPMAAWLEATLQEVSEQHFGRPACLMGEGGTIPFMGMLGERYPEAQFLITGVLGPGSNAHGPNEFLHLATGERLTACVAGVLARHAEQAG
ncbi:MAG: succinyl-diaminopimelate desuccinylase [Planctomycetota bacterium]|nr:MAG: succinyl-diaminopimelate desuccinylase [Planctomycetota bacterium]